MSAPLLLALDLGTTSVRALAVGAEGRVRARASRGLATRFPAPGRVEQDPLALWEASVDVLREALAAAGGAAAAIGVVSQRATAIAWDAASGAPLAPALVWQDQRTAERAAELRARGIPISAQPSATKFEWLLRCEPAVRAAAEAGRLCLGTPDAWLTWRLSGGAAFVTDPGQASCTALFDLAGGCWSAGALSLFGIEEGWLPRIVATAQPVGATPRGLLGAEALVAARAGDQQAASFAQGALCPGDAKLTLGTGAILELHTGSSPRPFARGAFPLALWQLADGAAYCLEASAWTAGAAVDWLVALGLLPGAEALDRVAGSVASCEGVVFVPALQGLGAPWLDEGARGLLAGLTRGTRSAHVVRAALDGVAQRCADLCDAVELAGGAELRVDGGLARSDLLLQRIADLAGRPLLRAAETETTALGAALLAGLGAGVFDAPERCAGVVAAPRRFEPACDAALRLRERAGWQERVERARPGWRERPIR